ncbi:MAG: hypothetical protein J6Z17_03030 [Treponema sp.]|nr:hypothetical protein [Treponema sp.]
MAQFGNPYFSKTSTPYISGKEKAAIFAGELNASAFSAVEAYLPHDVKVKLTKALKALGRRVDFTRETDVLEEANFWGVQRGIAYRIHTDEEIANAVEIHNKMNILRGSSASPVNVDPSVIASVLGHWLKEN